MVVDLLAGGDKSSQSEAIDTALSQWNASAAAWPIGS